MTQSNKRMHATRDTSVVIERNLVGGRVMRGVRWLHSAGDNLMRADRLGELAQTRMDYWSGLVKHMRRGGSAITFGAPGTGHQLRAKADTFGSGKFVLVALANVRPEKRIGAGVEISGPEEYYASLENDISAIEREIGCKLEWNRATKVRDIWLYRPADFFERQRWPEQHEWLRERLEAFRRVLKPRIAELLRGGS